ncbi:hypothetical protein HPB50_000012 [Hyalomma asiaticum]|uniref:Uncharacterized protein n=1 Tax=Hyalomma asiaticum TaxID=266040 RepID=A0ACB7RWQ3_HYAAI|nr:hypothetical protein HPB50_000012 [Hyalomma asiaticum]
MTAAVSLGVPVSVLQPSQQSAVTSMPLVERLKFSAFSDLQSPEVFLKRSDNICFISRIDEANRLSNVVAAALEGSIKLWWHFVGAFPLWNEFAQAFHVKFASISSKRCLKVELEQ